MLCSQDGVIKKDENGRQPIVVRRAVVAIVLSGAFPEDWEVRDEDFRDEFYLHRETITEVIERLVKKSDLK